MRVLLGIDGGGTKTDVLLMREDGSVLARLSGEGTNINDAGLSTVRERMRVLLGCLPEGEIASVYAGVAGCADGTHARELRACIAALLPRAGRVEVQSDILNAFYSVGGMRDGVSVVAGTGASAAARHGGEVTRVGGWGHLLDDAGSGWDVGRGVLRAVLRAHDGRGPKTALTELVRRELGANAWECINDFYKEGRKMVARFAPLAFEAEGDEAARAIVESAACELAALIRAAARRVDERPCFTVLCGGLWNARALYDRVATLLGGECELHRPALPPVCGCVAAAGERIGLDVLARLKEEFA